MIIALIFFSTPKSLYLQLLCFNWCMVRLSHLSVSLSNKDTMWIKIGFKFFVILHMNKKDLFSFLKKKILKVTLHL